MFLLFILFVIIAPQATAAVQCSEIKTAYRNACDCSVDSKFTGLDLMIFKPGDCEAAPDIKVFAKILVDTDLTAVGNTLYFSAYDGTKGGSKQLWKSDGTKGGTVMVKDIGTSTPSSLTAVGDTLYFGTVTDKIVYELWKSDDTGTVKVKERITWGARSLTAVGDTLYYYTGEFYHGGSGWLYDLWKSDDTGTVKVKERITAEPSSLTAVGNALYFVVRVQDSTGGYDYELWKSDDTGTVKVKELGTNEPIYLTAVGNTLYFYAVTDKIVYELWKSDDTGTVKVKDIGSLVPSSLIAVGNTLYFPAVKGDFKDLWAIKTEDKVMCSVNE